MHAYRDAIRDEQGRHVVEYAAILYPGSEVRFDEGLEALQVVPGMEQGFETRLDEVLTAALAGYADAGAGVMAQKPGLLGGCSLRRRWLRLVWTRHCHARTRHGGTGDCV
jgi:hypothetical protein